MISEKILAICEQHNIEAIWSATGGEYFLFRRGRNSIAIRSSFAEDEIEYHLTHFISQVDNFEKR